MSKDKKKDEKPKTEETNVSKLSNFDGDNPKTPKEKG
jgi:hypothetical protein